MTQDIFLSIMEKKLKKLEQAEKKAILADYNEHECHCANVV